jgi:hypothetical protein
LDGVKELKKLENNFNKGICYGTTTNYALNGVKHNSVYVK